MFLNLLSFLIFFIGFYFVWASYSDSAKLRKVGFKISDLYHLHKTLYYGFALMLIALAIFMSSNEWILDILKFEN